MNRFEFYDKLNKYKANSIEKKDDNSLSHYGTIGQKWGTRRWQNYDGTFNTAGKERYFGKNGTTKKNIIDDENIGGAVADYFHKNIYLKTDKNILKKIRKYPEIYNTEGLTDDEILRAVRRVPKLAYNMQGMDYGTAVREELYRTQQNKARTNAANAYTNSVAPSEEEKLGAGPIATLAFTVKSVIDGVHNYDDVQDLRDKYSNFMDASDAGFTSEERLSVLNNKKRIAKMEEALEAGNQEKYDKLLNKVKDGDREAVEKFLGDLNKKNNETSKVSDENQSLLNEQLGSISKPKIRKSYLNPDGTLNEKGKTRTKSNKKISDIASSVFMALRNINFFNAATAPVTGLVLSLTGFGIPVALAASLASAAVSSAAAGVDHALYKKLEKRADAYYEMLK